MCSELRLGLPKKVTEWAKTQQSDRLAQIELQGCLELGQGVDSNLAIQS